MSREITEDITGKNSRGTGNLITALSSAHVQDDGRLREIIVELEQLMDRYSFFYGVGSTASRSGRVPLILVDSALSSLLAWRLGDIEEWSEMWPAPFSRTRLPFWAVEESRYEPFDLPSRFYWGTTWTDFLYELKRLNVPADTALMFARPPVALHMDNSGPRKLPIKSENSGTLTAGTASPLDLEEGSEGPPSTILSAVQQIRRMRGGSQSHLMRASDGHYYITKFQNNPQHCRVLVNEFLASRLGLYLGLPMPEVAVIEVSDWLVSNSPELRMDTAGLTSLALKDRSAVEDAQSFHRLGLGQFGKLKSPYWGIGSL